MNSKIINGVLIEGEIDQNRLYYTIYKRGILQVIFGECNIDNQNILDLLNKITLNYKKGEKINE